MTGVRQWACAVLAAAVATAASAAEIKVLTAGVYKAVLKGADLDIGTLAEWHRPG